VVVFFDSASNVKELRLRERERERKFERKEKKNE
jgi:hypothetical protein